MKPLACPFLLLAATLCPAAGAQSPDPVPVRIAVDPYGSPSGNAGNTLALRLDADGSEGPQLVASGTCGATVVLLGRTSTALRGPFQTLVLASPDAIVPMPAGAGDTAILPLDLVNSALAGSIVFAQALSSDGHNVRMSAGLAVRFAAGNVQPALGYQGPPASAVLIADGTGTQRTHRIVQQVLAPTSGWTLTERLRAIGGGVTQIYLTLEAPGSLEVTKDIVEPRRCVIELGSLAQPLLEVWIAQTQRATTGPEVFLLAASIQRDF